jgi:hypothetical protein
MSIDFIKFNTIVFLWNYFLQCEKKKIDEKKSEVRERERERDPNKLILALYLKKTKTILEKLRDIYKLRYFIL